MRAVFMIQKGLARFLGQLGRAGVGRNGRHGYLNSSQHFRECKARHDAVGTTLEFFEKDIRPVLVERCYKCHSHESEKLKGGLYLDSLAGALKGGDTGPSIAPGHPDKSLLIEAINYKIEVVGGTVYVFGIGQDREEVERAVNHARGIEYVRKVVDHTRLKDDPRRPKKDDEEP